MNEKRSNEPRLETLAERHIHSDTGTMWRVREARASDVPGAEATTCLIFDSGKTCTRFWTYPAHWRLLSAVELLAILDNPRLKCAD